MRAPEKGEGREGDLLAPRELGGRERSRERRGSIDDGIWKRDEISGAGTEIHIRKTELIQQSKAVEVQISQGKQDIHFPVLSLFLLNRPAPLNCTKGEREKPFLSRFFVRTQRYPS